jgi:hypothetical protein
MVSTSAHLGLVLVALKNCEYSSFKMIKEMVIYGKVSELVMCTKCRTDIPCGRNYCRGRYLNPDGTWKSVKRHLNPDGSWKIDELNRVIQFHSNSSMIWCWGVLYCRNIKLGHLENCKYTYIKEF